MAKDKKSREGRTLGKAAGKRAKPADLTEDEQALWEFAAREIKPLKSAKGRVHLSQEPGAANATPRKDKAPEPAKAHTPPRVVAPTSKAPKTPPQKSPPQPLTTELGRRQARRIEVEARIDLHGMRQTQAHAALRRFLLSSHAAGKRWVLVITGKGTSRRDAREDDGFYGREEPGVLRRNVPRWLAEPDLRAIVVGYSGAAIRHGGEGALYVQLRRRERTGRS